MGGDVITATSTVTLSNGIRVPIIGLGCGEHGGYCHESVIFALKYAGYRQIDTSPGYGSEKSIGEDIKASGVSRDDIFITTKVWPTSYGYEETKRSMERSLENLCTTYIDLYLINWPGTPNWVEDSKECLKDTWKAIEEMYESGKCRAIGVANFLEEDLEEMLKHCRIKPHLNQIEFHPYCFPKSLIDYCEKNDITVGGHCPLAKSEIIKNNLLCSSIEQIAKNHDKSIAQILIRWSIQHGVIAIPKSTKMKRISENINVFDFELTEDEMIEMDSLCDVAYVNSSWQGSHMSWKVLESPGI